VTNRYRRGRRRFSLEHERRTDGKLTSSPDRPIPGRCSQQGRPAPGGPDPLRAAGIREYDDREIGEQAGVDAALIARYFGSKADLYIAAVVAEDAEGLPSEYEGLQHMADVMVTRADRRGPGSILQAIVRSDTSADILDAARDRSASRLIGPLVANMRAQGVDRPQLRAEVAVSALLGFILGRSLGWFDEIRSAPRDEVVALIVAALGAITGEEPEH
jgi:AcrR family transcriptional regulator